MCKIVTAFAIIVAIAGQAHAQEAIRLQCQIAERVTYLRGHFTGEWLRESNTSKIENITIDLTANTWLIEGESPRALPLLGVSSSEFILHNFSGRYIVQSLRINRISGEYVYELKSFESSKNETAHTRGNGTCKRALTKPQF